MALRIKLSTVSRRSIIKCFSTTSDQNTLCESEESEGRSSNSGGSKKIGTSEIMLVTEMLRNLREDSVRDTLETKREMRKSISELRSDFRELRSDFRELRSDFRELCSDMVETKLDMHKSLSELRSEMASSDEKIREEIKNGLNSVKLINVGVFLGLVLLVVCTKG